MKKVKLLILTLMLLGLHESAKSEDLSCIIKVNKEIAAKKIVSIKAGETFQFPDLNYFRIKIHNKGQSKFEIETFDAEALARNYSGGYLRTQNDELSWSLWSRDILIESSCLLNY